MLRSIPRFIAFLLAFTLSIALVSLSQFELYSIQNVQIDAPAHLEKPELKVVSCSVRRIRTKK